MTVSLLPLSTAACFNGDAAQGLPCQSDAQCGVHDACIKADPGDAVGVCGGAAADSGTDDDSGTTGGTTPACGTPLPSSCEGVAPAASVSFDTRVLDEVPGAGGNVAVVPGYFLGADARVDLAVANYFEQRISLYRNTGNASVPFERYMIDYFLPLYPYDLVGDDFDCDGFTDLATVSLDATELLVAYGTGDGVGEFVAKETVAEAWSMASGDLVGSDGRPELLVAGSTQIFLIESTERDWTATSQALDNGAATPWSTVIADINGDGVLDAVVPDADQYDLEQPTSDRVMLFTGERLELQIDYREPSLLNPIDAALIDIDGDDDLDMFVLSKHINMENTGSDQPATLSAHTNDGNGQFTQSGQPSTLGIGGNALASGDFNCDGYDDLVVGHDGGNGGVWILWGPQYAADTAQQVADDAIAGTKMAVSDFDGDGYPDLAVTDFGTLTVDQTIDEPGSVYVLLTRPGT